MIKRRMYRILSDFKKVYEFFTETYEIDLRNGVSPCFFEYGQSFQSFDYSQSHRIALWEEEGTLVSVVFYEIELGTAYFNLRPGYEFLADELIEYAAGNLTTDDKPLCLRLMSTQSALRESAAANGYILERSHPEGVYEFSKGLIPNELPQGYRFFDNQAEGRDMYNLDRCLWYGFGHGEEGEPDRDLSFRFHTMASPNFRDDLDVIVIAPNGEYVVYAGMWLIAEKGLAYLEPLCTLPEYRRLGLAKAALGELQRRTSNLGATHMTGGSNPFYFKIGYEEKLLFETWRKI